MPNDLMGPTTWAPMSTTSSGSTVPVALIVANRSPRVTVAVRKLEGASAETVMRIPDAADGQHADGYEQEEQ